MNTKRLFVISGVVVLAGALGGYAYYHNQHQQNNVTTAVVVTKKPATASNTTPAQTPKPQPASIQTTAAAGLFNASYSRKLTDFTAWQDSPVSYEYRDFNGDGVMDAFVWAKLPGTMGYSYAAVWTTDSNGQPKELWYLPNDSLLAHSTWTVTTDNGLENKSVNGDGTTNSVNTYHWQVSTTGAGFVLEPNI